ncbi:chitooligosaccharidolytic beta-N-acetylglucosaminidase-like [Palaemon carinicauda]|uniref:chitooligosaccharidolytic beta-N-acetylglucosaminidase-like n=1 Tax=Palaemon carinicauda TaxID=392227 RepID=UPI0035B63465
MKGKYCISTLFLGCLLVQFDSSVFAQDSPWGYRCDGDTRKCIKEEAIDPLIQTSFAQCKLTCNPYGVLWPKPTSVSLDDQVVPFLPSNVTSAVEAPPNVASLLDEAIAIFIDNLHKNYPKYSHDRTPRAGPSKSAANNHILHLDITVTNSDDRLSLHTDESYSLALATNGDVSTATIHSPTYFGARHALETLSQLTEYDEPSHALLIITSATIEDSPVFPYRGVLLDTARNFVQITDIERTLDAMSANKLNTFHWHITDTHSFPVYLNSRPEMTHYGAYSSREIYYAEEIMHIVEYGRIRGIRVLPEYDAPAHVGNGFQWGPKEGLGDIAVCVNKEPWASYCVEPPCGQLNLANPKMYDVLGEIYSEFVNLFGPIDLFHFGGDEVNLNCWNTTEEIVNWMIENDFGLSEDSYYDQWGVFQARALQLLTTANGDQKVPGILWTSHLTEAGRIEKYLPTDDYIIQIWTEETDPVIGELLDKNYRVIFSNYDHWYLDCGFSAWVGEGNNWCSPYKGWQTVYDNNPIEIASRYSTTFDPALILGGEAALWTEQADGEALDSRLWPRCAALGERLWGNPAHNWVLAESRFIHHRQRMVRRGIQADRIQPQWCHQNEGLCYA